MKVVCVDDGNYSDDSFDVKLYIKRGIIYHIIDQKLSMIYKSSITGGFDIFVKLGEITDKVFFRFSRFRPLGDENKLILPCDNDNERFEIAA